MKNPQVHLIVQRIIKAIIRLLFFLCLSFSVKYYLIHHYSLDLNYFWDYMFSCFSAGLSVILANNFPDIVYCMDAPNSGGAGTNQAPNQAGAGTNQVANQAGVGANPPLLNGAGGVGANPPLPNGAGGDGAFSEHRYADGSGRITVNDPTGIALRGYHRGRFNTYQPYARSLADTLQYIDETGGAIAMARLSTTDVRFAFSVSVHNRIRGDSPELREFLRQMA